MTVSLTMHRLTIVDGAAMPMDFDRQLGRLSLEDDEGNRCTFFMPAHVAVAMANAYRAAIAADAAPALQAAE